MDSTILQLKFQQKNWARDSTQFTQIS
jgi:hypothetical protein